MTAQPSVLRAVEDDAAVHGDHLKHHPTLYFTGRYGSWSSCSCGWVCSPVGTVVGAHLAFGQHLVDVR